MARTHIKGADGFALCGLKTREGDLRNYDYGTRDVTNVILVDIWMQLQLGSVKKLCITCEKKWKKENI